MEILKKSFIDVIREIVQIVPRETTSKLKQGYLSSIELDKNHILVYIMANREFLVLLSDKLLFDDNPSEDILKDLIGELANLVVGRAKVLFQEKGKHFTISPPIPCVKDTTIEYDEDGHFCIGDACCSIFIKRISNL